ncbi:Mitotic checkpoint protein BUB3 [Fasciola gigantica]|uniref:Mitotic checkpoint protein BUB3 n=1 Tax=Fasciola gigantica TaxID=46835 RepID=A0A504YSQ4_FASGI|nr:Mitotic checkpoint protein BUB3 [Fasciola gigantica]
MAPAASSTVDQYKLSSLPTDGVTAVHFQPGKAAPQFLVASSWDCTVRVYDVASGGQRMMYQHLTPVLDTTFSDTVHVLSGSLAGDLKLFDCNTNQSQQLGSCVRAISVMHYNTTIQACITGSWDCTVRIWDPRAASATAAAGNSDKGGAQSVHRQPNTVYTMDSIDNQLVVGTAGRHVLIWDLRQMHAPVEQRESSLRYQTRCIRCFPNGQGYILGSIEGRIAVEMFDPSPEVQKKKYAFKCHRVKENDKEIIHPVTALAFHQGYNTFASGGCDGFVYIWDGFNRKRLAQLSKYPASISSLTFSEDGQLLAIASSYMYERGPIENEPEPTIYIRSVAENEVKPKHLTVGASSAASGASAAVVSKA